MADQANGIYLPRNPKASPLFGLVEDHFDEFERVYDDRFADKHGFWRTVIRKIVYRFLDCGDLRHGFARIRCENPDCRNEMLLAFSCHGRYFCPSCHAKRVAAFADWLAAELLDDTPHRQYVFTIPKLLRQHFRFDRRLLGLLCSCAWAQLIEKVYLVSPLVCPKCGSAMNIISFIEDPPVVRKILKHLGMWEIKERPPPKRNTLPCTAEPIPEECLSWSADTMYDNVDQVYED